MLVYCYYGLIGPGRSAIQIERVFGEFPFTVNSPGMLAHGCINSFKNADGSWKSTVLERNSSPFPSIRQERPLIGASTALDETTR